MKRFISIFLALLILFAPLCDSGVCPPVMLFAEDSEYEEPISAEGVLAFPDNMKASVITIGYDFFKDESQSASQTQEEIDMILSDFEEYGFNTVIIETSYNGKVYYETDSQIFEHGSPLSMLLDSAISRNFFIYITFDINDVYRTDGGEGLNSRIDSLAYIIHRLTSKYLIDGIIFKDYYASESEQSYRDYRENGAGIGYRNWLVENNSYIVRLLSKAVHATNNSVSVGLQVDNAWLNESTDSRGSDTKDDFEAYRDGFSDTRQYILDGLADFLIVYCYGGLESVELKFQNIVSWWNGLAVEANIPMFVKHANGRISSSDRKWASDQILKQLEECSKHDAYRGSVFESYEQLKANDESTDALVRYYQGNINVNSLNKELKMVLPKSTDFVTYEPTVIFQGSYDENFEMYFQNKPITLNEAGNFYFVEDLDIGVNTFTFRNKSTEYKYRITRKVKVLQSIEPAESSTMYVEGSTRIAVDVIAYKGSKIKAILNGETISLTEEDIRSDDLDSNTNYTHFTGYFTAPEGIVGEEQDLGNIEIDGRYEDVSHEHENGAKVIVNAVPEQAEAAQLVRVKNDNTITYDYYTTDNVADPTRPRLPAGTIDVYVNTVTYSASSEGVKQTNSYYLTESGLRIKASDCELIDGYTMVNNSVNFNGGYTDSSGNTVVSLKLDYQTPFTVSFSPLSYDNPKKNSYLVSSFNPDYVIVTFEHMSSFGGNPSFPDGSIFSGGEWQYADINGERKVQLKLRLRKSGVYMGYSSGYDGSGGLNIVFNGYPTSLSGVTVVVDPGHGYNKSATTLDPGAVGHVVEQTINIAIAKKLTAALENAGARVYMLPTDTEYINLYDRSTRARRYNPDIYIAVHCNSVENGEGVRGVEAYYFTPFSQPLAALVSRKMAGYYQNNVYGDGKNRDRGAKYNYFAVTLEQEFASILVECGFVTDYKEAMAMNDSGNQTGLANAMVEAIAEYLARGR